MDRYILHDQVSPYLPDSAGSTIVNWILAYDVQFRITRPRSTKFGDYRHPWKNKGHRISVNSNLNQYSFLITTVHEFAHLKTWIDHKGKVMPHGMEWKNHFADLLKPFYHEGVFPSDIEKALHRSLDSPKASTCSDPHLYRVLRNYDNDPAITLEDLPDGAKFRVGKLILVKGKKRRTRYECRKFRSNNVYLVNGLSEVEPFLSE